MTHLCDEVADHSQVVILHSLMESCLARLAVLYVHICFGIDEQLYDVSATVLSRKVEGRVSCVIKLESRGS